MRRKKKIEDVRLIDIGDKGKAVGRTPGGEIVLVEGAVPGDLADVLAYKRKKGMKHCRVLEIKELSNERVEPFCTHFSVCGGCKWQHLSYDAQIRFKEKHVTDCIRRIANDREAGILPIMGGLTTRYYRNKLEFTFSSRRWLSEEEIAMDAQIDDRKGIGFHPPGVFQKVVDIHHCHLQPDPSNGIRNLIRNISAEKGYSFYDTYSHKGFLRNLIVRTSSLDQCMIALIVGEEREAEVRELLNEVLEHFPGITSVYYSLNRKKNDSIFDLDFVHLAGNPWLEEKLGEVTYRLGPKSFFQTNPEQAQRLYETAAEFAGLSGDEVVYDLYTGIGSIALFIAGKCKEVVGVEEIPEAIEDANRNARLNDITNATFYTGDASLFSKTEIQEKHGRPDVLISDPPRAGMHKDVIEGILELAPDRIVYVSCNPSTQARDIKMLSGSYRLVKVQPVDMFPHTHHVEAVALLKLKESNGRDQ